MHQQWVEDTDKKVTWTALPPFWKVAPKYEKLIAFFTTVAQKPDSTSVHQMFHQVSGQRHIILIHGSWNTFDI